jgi:hypothetical protein
MRIISILIMMLSLIACTPKEPQSNEFPKEVMRAPDTVYIRDTTIIRDTVVINHTTNDFDVHSCGDDVKYYPRRCTPERVRSILKHCTVSNMHWTAYESPADGRTTSLFCDAFEDRKGKSHK